MVHLLKLSTAHVIIVILSNACNEGTGEVSTMEGALSGSRGSQVEGILGAAQGITGECCCERCWGESSPHGCTHMVHCRWEIDTKRPITLHLTRGYKWQGSLGRNWSSLGETNSVAEYVTRCFLDNGTEDSGRAKSLALRLGRIDKYLMRLHSRAPNPLGITLSKNLPSITREDS